MANLLEISEITYRQLRPNPTDEEATTLEEITAAAKYIYAETMWRLSKEERAQEGFFNVPSSLISEHELEIENNRASIKELNPLRALPDDSWILNMGGFDCKCRYVKTNVNHNQILCDDDSLGDGVLTFMVVGNNIMFPKGAHANKVAMMFANNGSDLSERFDIAEQVGSIVQTKLDQKYLGKVGTEDVTNNGSSQS